MSSEELSQALKFIEEREQKLSRYTDKLRDAVDKIFQVFGDKDVCQICGRLERLHRKYYLPPDGKRVDDPKTYTTDEYVIMSRKEWEKDYFGKTHKQGKEIFIINEDVDHAFKPKIEVSFDFDGEPFFKVEEEGKECKLAIRNHRLVFFVKYTGFHEETYGAHEISRRTLKEAIQTGAITKFLQELAEELKAKEEEYGEVSSMAEKLANAVA
jgi:hypothetical protein